MAKSKLIKKLRNAPGWAIAIFAGFFTLFVLEMSFFAFLFYRRHANPEGALIHFLRPMVDAFPSVYYRADGEFRTPPYYPYAANYAAGDWSKTPAPGRSHPDGWVLPTDINPDGTQNYVKPEKEAGVIRIIALGGSTMIGQGQTSKEFTIPEVLGKLLRKKYPNKKERERQKNRRCSSVGRATVL